MEDIFELNDTISQLTRPKTDWLDQLNPEQLEAVETTEGPVLVLSGAGTGKTRVLTTRLAYVLAQNKARPWECLVVTFTNRAAREMRERVHAMIGETADSVWLGTFHSVCVKILRNHAELVNLRSNFTILGEDDQKRVIKQVIERENERIDKEIEQINNEIINLEQNLAILSEDDTTLNEDDQKRVTKQIRKKERERIYKERERIDDKKHPPQSILDKIQRWKDKGISVDKIDENSKDNITTRVYKLYQARLVELNCVDFGDILLYSLEILLKHADILDKYQSKFKYIMVDEYQDTNVTQYLFLRLLSQKYRNICVVGDDDQSIYSWRGAEIENILRFEKDFPDAKIIRLERNYRSTANILATASGLISNNTGRLGKTLKVAENSPAATSEDHKVKVVSNYNGEEEAKYIVDEIEAALRNGYEYANIAILVRTAFQTREFEEQFIANSIPYQVIGGLKFYERAEIRDALAYFRVILQKDDDLALERIINKPTRGVGAKAMETFQNLAASNRISLYDAVETTIKENLIRGKAKTSLEELFNNFAAWRKELETMKPYDLATLILEDSGYIDMLRNDKTPEAPGRIENLNELVNVMGDEEKYAGFHDFMEHVSLVMDNDSDTDYNRVQLITLHSAKGLEFDIVFLPGWEEALFPHQRALEEGGYDSLEEERRLAYVAITRARKMLYILTALNRRIYGQWQNNIPSRFINELPQPYIDICNNCKFFSAPADYRPSPTPKSKTALRGAPIEHYYEPDYSDNENLIGAKVYHQTFGYGAIRKIEGDKLGVFFFQNGYKNVMSNYVKLTEK